MAVPLTDLLARLKAYDPGDVLGAADLMEALEKAIVDDGTDFDDAAFLSRLLEDFSALVKEGVGADWASFLEKVPSAPEPELEAAVPTPAPSLRAAAAAKAPAAETPASETMTIDVDVEVLFSFLSEAVEHLESIEERILTLESNPEPAIVNEIFRDIHTIKGVSGFLNLVQIKSLAHEIEFLLDELRGGHRSVERPLVDVLLLGCDTLGQLVQILAGTAQQLKVEKGTARLPLPVYPMDPILDAVRGFRTPAAPEAPRVPAPAAAPPAPSSAVSDLLQSPELIGKFSQEALETLETVEACVLTMEKTRSTGDYLNEAFRSIHTLKGNAGFFGFDALESLCMDMESLLDDLRKGKKAVDSDSVEALLGALDRLRGLVQGAAVPRPAPAAAPAPAAPLKAAGPVPGDRGPGAAPAAAAPPASGPPAPAASAGPPAEAEAFGKYTVKKKDIRVDTEKLDVLFDLIGELITAEAMVIDNPELRGLDLESFPRAATYLSKITRELQAVTMSIRMIPLEGLFSKMHRLVRDLGRKFNKDIDLEISGAETEMDRNIIEEISDPLVHIIRNAIDHGIEDEAGRRAKGKATGGRIRLDARYEGNEIWITVADDGQGLDRARILEVAKARGLAAADDMADSEVWQLIFEPGFSTAKQVSEISGRGVGMDVVKKNLEKLRGQIDIQTVKDHGTDFVLKIPLTLAIIDGVTLKSGTTLYSIPIADVVEFQNYQADKVTQTDPGHLVLRLRDEVLPVLPLSDLFISKAATEAAPGTKRVSIIVKSQGRKMALVVDEIVGYKQIVLKALPESMAGLEGVSGCTILGNGEVSLIIDVNALFRRYLA